MEIGVLCSGKLGFQLLKQLNEKYKIVFVFTDSKSIEIINFCEAYHIQNYIGNPRSEKVENFVGNNKCDVLISVNYLFLVKQNVIDMAKSFAFNVHGSLLPKYRGRTPHVWAIINGESSAGITAHIIDDKCDTGDILEQVRIPITPNETGGEILKKYEQQYLPLINRVLCKYANNELQPVQQNNVEATYFGKRTPNDGLIDWDWQKERIHNWVRAQAAPYPGAFTFYKKNKVIIDEVSFSNEGFDNITANGTILNNSPLVIKSPNGAVEIIKLRDSFDFKIGEILK